MTDTVEYEHMKDLGVKLDISPSVNEAAFMQAIKGLQGPLHPLGAASRDSQTFSLACKCGAYFLKCY